MSRLQSLREDPSLRRPVIAFAVVLAAVVGGEVLLTAAFADAGAGVPAWLPQFGTVGQTVLLYSLLSNVLSYVALPATLFWVGYAYGHRSGRRTGSA